MTKCGSICYRCYREFRALKYCKWCHLCATITLNFNEEGLHVQLLHSLYIMSRHPYSTPAAFSWWCRSNCKKRLGLLNFTWGSWKLCVGSPTVSNFSKLVSTPDLYFDLVKWAIPISGFATMTSRANNRRSRCATTWLPTSPSGGYSA